MADVAWASRAFLQAHGTANPYPAAPEILVEVLSPSDSLAEMAEKKGLYFARGAREVWVCAEAGDMHFFGRVGRMETPGLAPGFPVHVDLPFG